MRWPVVLALLLIACEPEDVITPRDAGGVVSGECDVPALFARSCFGGCHEAAAHQASLDLETPGLGARVYNQRAAGRPDYLLVDSELPDESALVEKLQFPTPFGSFMPLGRTPFTTDEIACVQAWVNQVAAGGLQDPKSDGGAAADGGGGTEVVDAGPVVDAGRPDAGRFWGPSVDSNECVPDGGVWCIVEHVPEPLYAVRGISATNVWAVGSRGAAYHFDGTSWQRSDAGTNATLFDVFPAGANDVWAVGERGLVLRNQGAGWREVGWAPNAAYPDAGLSPTGQPRWDLGGVYASGGEVWVVGSGQTVAKLEGSTMRISRTTHPNAPGPDLLKLWRRSATEWWAAGETFMQYDGGSDGWVNGRGTVARPFSIAGAEHPTTHAPILVAVGSAFNVGPSILAYSYTEPGGYPWQPPDFLASRYDLKRDLRAIWLAPDAKGWTVGLDGQLLELNMGVSRGYVRHVSPTKDHLLGVWGTAVNSTWAVGGRSAGVILKTR